MSSSVVLCNAAGEREGRPPGAWAVGWPTLHGGPVRLRPVKATPCLFRVFSSSKQQHQAKKALTGTE